MSSETTILLALSMVLTFALSFELMSCGIAKLAESERIKRNNEDNKTYNRLEKIVIEKCLTCPKFHSETLFKEMNEIERFERAEKELKRK